MRKRRMDARTQMGRGNSGTHRQSQIGKQLVKPVQDRRSLGDMAESVSGNADDKVWDIAHWVEL